jgi:hypothetical protein
MCDLTHMSIFINYSLYINYSSLPKMGLGRYTIVKVI